jgi:hypothetical protein
MVGLTSPNRGGGINSMGYTKQSDPYPKHCNDIAGFLSSSLDQLMIEDI